MFEKYNEKARRALFFARYEASKLGSRVIESEHILLGVLREGEEIIKEIFSRFNVKPEQIRREVEGDRLFVDRISSSAELPSPRSRRRSSPTPPTRRSRCSTSTSAPNIC
ncbi:MAG TPA: Clp protease N-terminal domain-containing protein [Thermoanaerobaculia bacterium]|nr:Clp protease N-terminal domain-containing protein [Thermoanaerobaculia bacterium]